MRLWSIHPCYLDSKGLVAVWREGLLAMHVLAGKTKGYTHHPQLQRFRTHREPLNAITRYLHAVVDEADTRHYSFNRSKLITNVMVDPIPVTRGQVTYEVEHLGRKLTIRDPLRIPLLRAQSVSLHPLFTLVEGEVESWEKNTIQ